MSTQHFNATDNNPVTFPATNGDRLSVVLSNDVPGSLWTFLIEARPSATAAWMKLGVVTNLGDDASIEGEGIREIATAYFPGVESWRVTPTRGVGTGNCELDLTSGKGVQDGQSVHHNRFYSYLRTQYEAPLWRAPQPCSPDLATLFTGLTQVPLQLFLGQFVVQALRVINENASVRFVHLFDSDNTTPAGPATAVYPVAANETLRLGIDDFGDRGLFFHFGIWLAFSADGASLTNPTTAAIGHILTDQAVFE